MAHRLHGADHKGLRDERPARPLAPDAREEGTGGRVRARPWPSCCVQPLGGLASLTKNLPPGRVGKSLLLDRGDKVGHLYDDCQRIQEFVERNGLDVFKSRGELALRCGFLISLVGPDDPDDSEKIRALHEAAFECLGLRLD